VDILLLLASYRATRWAINIRREDLVKKSPEYLNKNCRICSEHFESVMFLNDLKNRLQPTAIPTLVDVSNPPLSITPARTNPRKRQHATGKTADVSKIKRSASRTLEKSATQPSTSEADCKFRLLLVFQFMSESNDRRVLSIDGIKTFCLR